MTRENRPVVVMSERLGAIGDEERRIEQAGAELRLASLWDLEQITVNAADASVILLGAVEPFDEAALAALPRLRAIVRRGVGHDNVDTDAATRLGIPVAIVPDASVEEVSDHALTLLLTLERRIIPVDAAVHAGQWQRDPTGIQSVRAGARRFAELYLGIIGFGRIGQALARKARPLYRGIMAADPAVDPVNVPPDVELVGLEELVGRADHISIHAPLIPSTRNLVGDELLDKVRPGAMIVNTSRGGLVNEASVRAAVADGRLGGAGLDVTVDEPLSSRDPLLAATCIVLTAHSAGGSTTARRELSRRAVDAVIEAIEGRSPTVLANPEVLKSPALRLGTESPTGIR